MDLDLRWRIKTFCHLENICRIKRLNRTLIKLFLFCLSLVGLIETAVKWIRQPKLIQNAGSPIRLPIRKWRNGF